jgi:predicted kinase
LIGVPGSGKSTWIKNQEWAKDCVVISTDNHVEAQAIKEGRTYSEVFTEFMPLAVRLMADDVVNARVQGRDIIWDQTSTTAGSRRKKFGMLPKYEHIAVVFVTPPSEELATRLASRPGKHIPQHVMTQMIEQFEQPTLEEGYKEIWRI